MINQIVLSVDGLNLKDSEHQVTDAIMGLSGIEYVEVSAKTGRVTVGGWDLDDLQLADTLEALGFTVIK